MCLPADPSAHATAVASLAVGSRVDGRSIGVAPGARLVAIDALGAGDVLARVVMAMDAAARAGATVICLPMGTRSLCPIVALAAYRLERDLRVITVVPAGNDGPGALRSPADFSDVLAVGACDRAGRAHDRSGSRVTPDGRCTSPDVLAPGVDVAAASGRTGFALVTGTSFAAGHVAGLVALLRQAAPEASTSAVRAAIIGGAHPPTVDGPGRRSVAGLIDAVAAHDLLRRRRRGWTSRMPVDAGPTRASVVTFTRWIDPFLTETIAERTDRAVTKVIVGCVNGQRIERILEAARCRSGVDPVGVARQHSTGTATVRAPHAFVAALCEDPELDIICAARVPMTIPRRYAWR